MKQILVLTVAFIIGITLYSCGGKGKTPTPNNTNQEYKTTYRIELSDGRIFEGVSNKNTGQLCENDGDEKYVPFAAFGIDGGKDNQLSGAFIIDGDNLLPLGSKRKNFSESSLINLMLFDKAQHYTSSLPSSSSPVTGTHSISNFKKHDYATSSAGIDKATFRYEFGGVVLSNVSSSGADVTASGYIQCVVN